jgi:hypothetical protein
MSTVPSRPTDTHSPAFLRRRKSLLFLPLVAFPFLAFVFYSLGGGQGPKKALAAGSSILGFNMELPMAKFNRRDSGLNKLGYYQKADADSLRKREFGQRDPYLPHPNIPRREFPQMAAEPPHGGLLTTGTVPTDQKADELLRQIDRIRKSMQQPGEAPVPVRGPAPLRMVRPVDTPASDPQIERINGMLDKILKIQHPGEQGDVHSAAAAAPAGTGVSGELLAADSSNTVPAEVQRDQTLTTGATIALRLMEDAVLNGIRIPKDQLVYGVVNINNDRMQVSIHSIYANKDIYTISIQVYDMDGLPGIHIPGMLSRDVAKQSADQVIGGFNPLVYDPGLGAQAANAGIQTAKSLFSRKVRLVRISVRAGYQVLLRNTRSTNRRRTPCNDSSLVTSIQPPGIVPGGSFLRRCRTEGMELECRGIYLKDDLLWFALALRNRSPIGYVPDYVRWFIRDRKQFKRTAVQDLPVSPVYSPPLATVAGDSTCEHWMGFRPFALGKDKELVLEMGERGGGRELRMVIGHKDLLNAKKN